MKSLKIKLLLMAILPIIIISFLSGVGLYNEWKSLLYVERSMHDSQFQMMTSKIINELQKERGMSVMYLEKTITIEKLNEQQIVTNELMKKLLNEKVDLIDEEKEYAEVFLA